MYCRATPSAALTAPLQLNVHCMPPSIIRLPNTRAQVDELSASSVGEESAFAQRATPWPESAGVWDRGAKRRELAWIWNHDQNFDSLLCGDEIPPVLDLLVFAAARKRAGGNCLRFNQVELGWHLAYTNPKARQQLADAVPPDQSPHLIADDGRAYKFQDVPDYLRKCQWPLASAEGVEAMATWVWHGPRSKITQSWKAADVQAGDSIVVRGQDGHKEFWTLLFPQLQHPVKVFTQAEGVDALPGRFASHLDSDKLIGWWSMNNDGRHTDHPKMHSFPIGQLWKTEAEAVLDLDEPPVRDIVLYAVFSASTHPDRARLQKHLASFPGAMRSQGNRRITPAENWRWLKRSRFVVSPWGAGQSDNSVTPFLPTICSRSLVDCVAPPHTHTPRNPPATSRCGSLRPSIYADVRDIDDAIAF